MTKSATPRRLGVFVGDGKIANRYFDTYHAAIMSAITRLGLQNAVTCYGAVTDPASWLQTIDVFVSNRGARALRRQSC